MKNIMQKLRVIPLIVWMGLFAAISQPISQAMAPQMSLSEEDLKFLEEAQKEVEKYVNNLPTEASLRAQGLSDEQIKKAETKEKFDREVERLSKMSEDDLIKEIEKAISDVNTAQTPQAEPELPAVSIRQDEDEKKPEPKPIIPTNKQTAALQLIDALIMSIDNFLRKAQMMVELPGKIITWNKEGKLKGWQANLTWNTFKDQIEDLTAKLRKLKDRDPKSMNYKYLDEFIKDESTYNNITKVKDSLSRYEPKIELSSFGIDKMTSDARQATRTVLVSLLEATSIMAVPSSIDKIFEKYEPTAKKIKETEDAAQKRALEQSRAGRIPGSLTVGTSPASRERKEGYGQSGYGQYDYDRDGRYYSPGSYESPNRGGAEKSTQAPSKGLGAPAAGKAAGSEGKKPEEGGKKPEEKREPDKKADQFEGAYNTALDAFKEIYEENDNFKNIEKHFKNKNNFVDDVTMNAIKTATQSIGRATTAVKRLKGRLPSLNDAQKKEYKKAIKDGFKEVKSDFESMVSQINILLKPNVATMIQYSSNPAQAEKEQQYLKAKFYSYFNKKYQSDLQKFVDDKRKRLAAGAPLTGVPLEIETLLRTQTANLEDLKTNIQALKKTVEEL